MSAHVISKAEVISCQLEVPTRALERLPDDLRSVPLRLEWVRSTLILRTPDKSCQLDFQVVEKKARLGGIRLTDDVDGAFFEKVVATLMVRFAGDLHIRLFWKAPADNAQGSHSDVRFRKGESDYRGITTVRNELVASEKSRAITLVQPFALELARQSKERPALEPPENVKNEEDAEVERLLTRAKESFAAYLRANRRLLT